MSFERWNIIEASIRLGSGTTFYFSVTNEDYKEMMTSTNLKVLLVSKENLSSFKIYFKKDYFRKPLLSLFWNRIISQMINSLTISSNYVTSLSNLIYLFAGPM